MADSSSVRVLHAVHNIDHSGVSNWLLSVLGRMKDSSVRSDIVIIGGARGVREDEFGALCGSIFRLPMASRFWSFVPRYLRLLREEGPYDVVHSHFLPSGLPLIWARCAGVPVRVVHSHSASPDLVGLPKLVTTLLYPLTSRLIRMSATRGIGCSEAAIASRVGPGWQEDSRWEVLYYGIDLSPFREPRNRRVAFEDLGIAEGRRVVGFVGRMAKQKNPMFLVEVMAEVARRYDNAHLLLIGDGPFRESMERFLEEAELASRATFTGMRDDVACLMRDAIDVLLLPSLWEGLPITLLESQAAGLPAVVADNISTETDVVPSLIERVSLARPASDWAVKIVSTLERQSSPSPSDSLPVLEASPFNIECSADRLALLYRQAHDAATGKTLEQTHGNR